MFFKYKNFSLDGGGGTSAVLADNEITVIRRNGGAEKVMVCSAATAPTVGQTTKMNAKAACCFGAKNVCLAGVDAIKID